MTPRPAVWAGVECSFLTVGERLVDQLRLTGHHRRPADLDRLAGMGVTAIRYPVLWGRSRDPRETTDWRWADARLERLARLGVEPIVGLLHHGFGPQGADPLDPAWPAAFGRYAAEVALRYPHLRSFLPLNEPLTTARFGGLYGWWPPYGRDPGLFATLLLAQCRAYVEAARAIRSVRPDAILIVNEDVGRPFGTPAMQPLVDEHDERRWLTFDLLTGRVDRGHPAYRSLATSDTAARSLDALCREPQPPSLLGVDYYVTSDRWLDDRVDRFPSRTHGLADGRRYADVEAVRVAGSPPVTFVRPLVETWERYRLPVALTEVQLAGTCEDQVAWWWDAVEASRLVAGAGIPVAGVTAWSAFGAYDWDSVLREPRASYERGCFEVVGGCRPARSPLALAVAAAARGDPRLPEDHAPWWRRADRIHYPAPHPDGEGRGGRRTGRRDVRPDLQPSSSPIGSASRRATPVRGTGSSGVPVSARRARAARTPRGTGPRARC